MFSHVTKRVLKGSVAALALLAAAGYSPAYADPALEVEGGSTNTVEATQDLWSQIPGSAATVQNNAADDVSSRNGNVEYRGHTFSAPGVYTLQNQAGMNDAGNAGTNIAAQINGEDRGGSLQVEWRSNNRIHAHQTMNAMVGPGSAANVENTTAGGVGFFGGGDRAGSRTGDVRYNARTFEAPGVFTLQNNLGNNVAANAATQVAAQLNSDEVEIEHGSGNQVLAHQALTSYVSGSTALVHNASATGDVYSRTGDITYGSTTFDAPGVYTLANNTGLNVAGNTATNIAAQMNGVELGSLIAP